MSRPRQLVVYFVAVYLLTWGIAAVIGLAPSVVAALGPVGTGSPLFYLAVYVPSVTGVVLTGLFEGRAGLSGLGRRLNPLRLRLVWYLIAFLALPIAGSAWVLATGHPLELASLSAVPTILGSSLLLDPGPIGEELGWRGFALPRLLEQFSPAMAALILGVVWGIWHLPVFVIPGFPQNGLNFPLFIVSTVTLTILMTWCHLHTGGHLLPAIIVHLMANHTGELIGSQFGGQGAGLAVLSVLILGLDRKRFFARPAGGPTPSAVAPTAT